MATKTEKMLAFLRVFDPQWVAQFEAMRRRVSLRAKVQEIRFSA